MSDFFQPGVVTTLHRFKKVNLERMEIELEFHAKHNPIALVLPSLPGTIFSLSSSSLSLRV